MIYLGMILLNIQKSETFISKTFTFYYPKKFRKILILVNLLIVEITFFIGFQPTLALQGVSFLEIGKRPKGHFCKYYETAYDKIMKNMNEI